MKKTKWIAVLFVVAVIGAIVATTFSGSKSRCEACVVFNGRKNCATVSARTRDEALRQAVTTACEAIAGGVDETIRCENTQPSSVVWK